jgi:hypothetical protein
MTYEKFISLTTEELALISNSQIITILPTEEPLGIYAQRWLTWAEKNYP